MAVLLIASQVVDVFPGREWCSHRDKSCGTELTEFEQAERDGAHSPGELALSSGAFVFCDSGRDAETVPVRDTGVIIGRRGASSVSGLDAQFDLPALCGFAA
jgi:hypothetical protein